jgi:hypothetical protein
VNVFHEKNEIAAKQARQRIWIAVVFLILGALLMLPLILGR